MSDFTLKKSSILSRDDLYKISTNIANFHNVFPKYFKSIKILEKNDYSIIALEEIHFLGTKIQVKTMHEVFSPDTHNVHILSGPLRGTSFVEKYDVDSHGTKVSISVDLKSKGFFSYIPFLNRIMERRMNKVLTEFILVSEKYFENSILSK